MTTPDTETIANRQDKLETEIIGHIEHLTQKMTDSFNALEARLEKIESTHTYHKEILLSHGELLREHGDLLRQILKAVQQKGE